MTAGRRIVRRGVTLIELVVVVGIIGVLTGLALPVMLSVRQTAVVNQAMADLRAVDVAIQANCGKGRCGSFRNSAYSSHATTVPAELKEFLPLGFTFKQDTGNYAIEMNTWLVNNAGNPAWPLCLASCMAALQQPSWNNDNLGFTNSAGFTAPPTIYINIMLTSRSRDVLMSVYSRVKYGSAPVFDAGTGAWTYYYPAMYGIPATG